MEIFSTLLLQPLANGLILFYRLLGQNLGLAIIAFSLFLRVVLNPLTKPYMDSMKKMKDLAPQLAKIKKKHAGDRMKLAQAQADLYKEKGVNPGAGCLPYILQIVILIAFFNMFTRVFSGDNLSQNFNAYLYSPLRFETNEIVNTQFLYLDLRNPDSFGVSGLPFKLPGLILILSAVAQLLSAKIMAPYSQVEKKVAEKTKDSSDDMQVAIQQSMVYTFPLMTLFIGLNFPSGLALYWFVFSASQVFQQYKSQGWGGLTPWINKIKLVK